MPFLDPNPVEPAIAVLHSFQRWSKLLDDPPPYFLSSPVETIMCDSSSAVPRRIVDEMDQDQDSYATLTPCSHANRRRSTSEHFPPEEEQRLLSAASLQKASGNTLFATSHYIAAIDAYTLALASTPAYLDHETAILHSNLAACHLKLSAPTLALTHASEAIARRPGWCKPLVRRCKAREMLGTWKGLETTVAEYEALLGEGDGGSGGSGGGGGGGSGEQVELTAAERRECRRSLERCRKMLEEVRGKEMAEAVKGLKSLGDGLLRPFGMSTSDFGMKPDGKGGYSLEFRRGG